MLFKNELGSSNIYGRLYATCALVSFKIFSSNNEKGFLKSEYPTQTHSIEISRNFDIDCKTGKVALSISTKLNAMLSVALFNY